MTETENAPGKKEVEAAALALLPFVGHGQERIVHDDAWDNHNTIAISVTVGDLRAAMAAYEGLTRIIPESSKSPVERCVSVNDLTVEQWESVKQNRRTIFEDIMNGDYVGGLKVVGKGSDSIAFVTIPERYLEGSIEHKPME
jgi:hypothetical protein